MKEATDKIKNSLEEKGFILFGDVDHQANAKNVDLTMPASRTLIFGNPLAGTKLMQQDITMSLELPLRVAIVDDAGQTLLVHKTAEDYANFDVKNHPVINKIEDLFATLAVEL